MDRNAKLKPLSFDEKVEMLHKLEGTVYFQKTLTKTDALRRLTVPLSFVEKHGDMVRRSILLRTPSSQQSWTVDLNISLREEGTQVRAVGGWKEFVRFHGLSKGDLLIFSLTEISEFEVHLYRSKAWIPGELHSQPSSRPFDEANLSSKKPEQSDKHSAGEGSTQDPARSSGSSARRKEQVSGLGSSSISIDLKLHSNFEKAGGGDSPDGNKHRSHTAHDVADVHNRRDLKPNCDTLDGPAKQTVSRMRQDNPQQGSTSLRKSPQPSFFKELTVSNVSHTSMGLRSGLLEIPTPVWRTFGKRIHTLVKLQGVGEDSPTRTVTCSRHVQKNRYWRLRLKDGWREFASENTLEENQVLQFTLAGDSFFVVRLVDLKNRFLTSAVVDINMVV